MSEPITTALRGLLCAKPKGDACWDAMDAVDAVYAALEAENAALRAKVEELDNVGGSMHDGESITDELRKWVRDGKGSLLAIADRIDAEHESACKSERGEGIRIAEEAALEEMEHEYVKLPVDADGEVVRIGDVMVMASHPFGCEDKPLVVDRMELSRGMHGEVWCLALDTDRSCWTQAAVLRHHHAPTVEDVLREFAYGLGVPVADSYVAATAAKLRLAGDE